MSTALILAVIVIGVIGVALPVMMILTERQIRRDFDRYD